MRQFVYQPHHLSRKDWPDWSLRLSGMYVTENPDEADVFVVPPTLTNASRYPSEWMFPTQESLYRLPYMKGREDRHVFMDGSDNTPLYDMPCLFIRQNTRPWYLQRDPNTISWPWPVDDYSQCMPVPPDGFKYDLSFHGWITSHDTRTRCFEAMQASPLKCDLAGYTDFTGYIWDTPEGLRRRSEFRRSLQESRIAMCPESIDGVFPYRFWEAMSAGRVAVLVGNDFCFPFLDEINYSEFSIFIPREHATGVSNIVGGFLKTHSDDQIIEMGRKARHYWEKFLQRDKWPELMSYAVQRKLGVLQAA